MLLQRMKFKETLPILHYQQVTNFATKYASNSSDEPTYNYECIKLTVTTVTLLYQQHNEL